MKNLSLVLSLALIFSSAARAAPQIIASKLFEIGKTNEAPLFTQETRLEDLPDGTVKSSASIKDAAGTVVMTEVALLKDGQIVSQEMEQLQIKEAYELAQEDGNLIFRTYSLADGKKTLTKEKKEKRPENFITGPSTQPFFRARMEDFKAGKDVAVNFGIFEVSKTVKFDLSPKENKDGRVRVKMTPDSFLISMFVSPIYMTFDLSSGRLVGFTGRTPLKKLVRGNLKPFDAEITYSFLNARP